MEGNDLMNSLLRILNPYEGFIRIGSPYESFIKIHNPCIFKK